MKGFIKYLLREGLLFEKDNRVLLKSKLGLSDRLSNLAHEISDKYSIWIGNQFKGKSESEALGIEGDLRNIIELFKIDNKPKTDINKLDFSTALNLYNTYTQSVKDWLNSPEVRNSNIRNLTWKEAISKADEWHDSLGSGGALEGNIIGGKDDIIHEFGDGFMWVLHKDYKCDASEKSMGHCGAATNNDMFLLRLIKGNEEFITGDWDPIDKYIIQLKGKGNNKPHEKYHKYILWLLVDWGNIDMLKTNEGYRPDTNFQLTDLSDENFNYILDKSPNLFDESTVKNYFYNLYNSGDKNKLKEVITNFITDDTFITNINKAWVWEIIRYGNIHKMNLTQSFIDKLINDGNFLNNINSYYDIEYLVKNTNNPIEMLKQFSFDFLYKFLIVDDYLSNFLNHIGQEENGMEKASLIVDYLLNYNKFIESPKYVEVYLNYTNNPDAIIDILLNHKVIDSAYNLIQMLEFSSRPKDHANKLGEKLPYLVNGIGEMAKKSIIKKSKYSEEVSEILYSNNKDAVSENIIRKKIRAKL